MKAVAIKVSARVRHSPDLRACGKTAGTCASVQRRSWQIRLRLAVANGRAPRLKSEVTVGHAAELRVHVALVRVRACGAIHGVGGEHHISVRPPTVGWCA